LAKKVISASTDKTKVFFIMINFNKTKVPGRRILIFD
jgi:hypothetical protein